jgi:hypothetical protein
VGKGGDLWKQYYQMSVLNKHPDPEKMADSLLRNREKTLELQASRKKIEVTLKAPKPVETAHNEAKKGRVVPSTAFRCKATKLDGKQCVFKRFGTTDFCSKHAVKKT